MVEHLAYTERVGGSSPSPPTSPLGAWVRGCAALWAFCAAAACVCLLAAAPAAADPAPMTFRLANLDSNDCGANCPQVIVADGVIEAETPQAFVDFAKQAAQSQPLRMLIFMNSPGGNVAASMELGAAFRRGRAAVVVAGFASVGWRSGPVRGVCLSACVYALMGAIERVAPPDSQIGLHRMSIEASGENGGGLADRRMVATLASYAARMGVSPALVWHAESQTPGTLHILSPAEIARWRLASTRF